MVLLPTGMGLLVPTVAVQHSCHARAHAGKRPGALPHGAILHWLLCCFRLGAMNCLACAWALRLAAS